MCFYNFVPLFTLITLFFLFFSPFGTAVSEKRQEKDLSSNFSLVFGSCNEHEQDQSFWQNILHKVVPKQNSKLDLMVWLGDIVYLDEAIWFPYIPHHRPLSEEKMLEIWNNFSNNPHYRNFVSKTRKVVGIYDDHDAGLNDEGMHCPTLEFNQKQLLKFLNNFESEKEKQVRSERKGVYAFHKIPFAGFEKDPLAKPVCVILLDGRTHRENPFPGGKSKILGETQWKWFEKVLKFGRDPDIENIQKEEEEEEEEEHDKSKNIDDVCAFTFIGTGVQIIIDSAPMENWGEYGAERDRLFRAIAKSKARRISLLTGDVHYSEAGKLAHYPTKLDDETQSNHGGRNTQPLAGKESKLFERCPESIWPDQDLYEFTASGFTHHEVRLFDEQQYNYINALHRRLPPGVWIQNNAGSVHVACKNVHDPETCQIQAKLYELPMVNETFSQIVEVPPKSKRIKDINAYFKEKYPQCTHLHNVEENYTLPVFYPLWLWSIEIMKEKIPFLRSMFRLEMMFIQMYLVIGIVVSLVVLIFSCIIWKCCCRKKSNNVSKTKKE